jgi:tight adherence protein B
LRGRVTRIQRRFGARQPTTKVTETRNLRAGAGLSSMPRLEAFIKRLLPRPAQLRDRLDRTGKSISIVKYVAISFAVGISATAIRAIFFDFPPILAILFGIAAGAGLPHLVIGFLIKRRVKQFTATFAEAIDLIIRGLKSGLPVPESIRTVGEEFKGPVGSEFRLVADRIKLGESMDQALLEASKRINTAEFQFFVISLAVQRETGGNLAETLENLSDILRKRRQMHLKIKAMSSEAKASAIIIGSLPFIMFVMLRLVNGQYVMGLFNDPRGLMLVGIGFAFLIVGIAVMMKMVKFEI